MPQFLVKVLSNIEVAAEEYRVVDAESADAAIQQAVDGARTKNRVPDVVQWAQGSKYIIGANAYSMASIINDRADKVMPVAKVEVAETKPSAAQKTPPVPPLTQPPPEKSVEAKEISRDDEFLLEVLRPLSKYKQTHVRDVRADEKFLAHMAKEGWIAYSNDGATIKITAVGEVKRAALIKCSPKGI